MNLRFDPGQIHRFKAEIRQISGYPTGEELPIREMVFESDALSRLPDLLVLAGARPKQGLLVVMDPTRMRRGRTELKPLVLAKLQEAGWQPEPLWLEPDANGQVHTEIRQIERVKAHLLPGRGILAVGSGTVTDIAKHACYLYQQKHLVASLPFVVYQTANSVSAYTSNTASVFIDGVKRTFPSRYPDVLVCDLQTLRDAPKEMTVAGVGDLVAAFGSFADWYLAYQLGMDPTYNEFARTLMGSLDEILLQSASEIRRLTLEGMEVLAKLISLAGLAMSLSHATAPLSGYEHGMSHVLDLLAERNHRPLAQHGTQVALSTILSTAAYRIFLSQFEPARLQPDQCYPSVESMHARIQAAFDPLDSSGRVAAECWSDYRPKVEKWHAQRDSFENFLQNWQTIRAELQALTRPPELIASILRDIESPLGFNALVPSIGEDQVKFAFLNAPLIRKRFTLGDLLIFLNWDRETIWNEVWAVSCRLAADGGA